ncbi:hypothetical protein C8R45DRAFT_946979 [Mycena sanguinolenta]|nr:hypothetical protein C8R45DRAFT_946979 [Mycena sanguinolenta]
MCWSLVPMREKECYPREQSEEGKCVRKSGEDSRKSGDRWKEGIYLRPCLSRADGRCQKYGQTSKCAHDGWAAVRGAAQGQGQGSSAEGGGSGPFLASADNDKGRRNEVEEVARSVSKHVPTTCMKTQGLTLWNNHGRVNAWVRQARRKCHRGHEARGLQSGYDVTHGPGLHGHLGTSHTTCQLRRLEAGQSVMHWIQGVANVIRRRVPAQQRAMKSDIAQPHSDLESVGRHAQLQPFKKYVERAGTTVVSRLTSFLLNHFNPGHFIFPSAQSQLLEDGVRGCIWKRLASGCAVCMLGVNLNAEGLIIFVTLVQLEAVPCCRFTTTSPPQVKDSAHSNPFHAPCTEDLRAYTSLHFVHLVLEGGMDGRRCSEGTDRKGRRHVLLDGKVAKGNVRGGGEVAGNNEMDRKTGFMFALESIPLSISAKSGKTLPTSATTKPPILDPLSEHIGLNNLPVSQKAICSPNNPIVSQLEVLLAPYAVTVNQCHDAQRPYIKEHVYDLIASLNARVNPWDPWFGSDVVFDQILPSIANICSELGAWICQQIVRQKSVLSCDAL